MDFGDIFPAGRSRTGVPCGTNYGAGRCGATGIKPQVDHEGLGQNPPLRGMKMCKCRESRIHRLGFPIDSSDAKALLHFINLLNPSHDMIEAEIVVKLELLSRKYCISEVK